MKTVLNLSAYISLTIIFFCSCTPSLHLPPYVSIYYSEDHQKSYPEIIFIYEPYHTMEIYTPYFSSLKVTGKFSKFNDTLFFLPYSFDNFKEMESINYNPYEDKLDSLGISYHPFNLPRLFLLKRNRIIDITKYDNVASPTEFIKIIKQYGNYFYSIDTCNNSYSKIIDINAKKKN